jgi:NAD+ diphosphatase
VPLNRLSWLRTSPAFLNVLAARPDARFVAFHAGAPLTALRAPAGDSRLVALSLSSVRSLVGDAADPVFGHGERVDERAPQESKVLEAARLRGAPLVFLGVRESAPNDFGPTSAEQDHERTARELNGSPYFSVDVTDAGQDAVDALVRDAAERHEGTQVAFVDARAATKGMGLFDLSVFAEARSMVDWNARNKVLERIACGARNGG